MDKTTGDLMIKLDQFNTDYEVFKTLKSQEQKAAHTRLDEYNIFYKGLVEKEAILQSRYALLKEDKEELIAEIAGTYDK